MNNAPQSNQATQATSNLLNEAGNSMELIALFQPADVLALHARLSGVLDQLGNLSEEVRRTQTLLMYAETRGASVVDGIPVKVLQLLIGGK